MSESRISAGASSVHTALSVSSSPLSRFASSTQPALEELTLANILNGDTCPPISFIDFASFVANKEYTTENLLFILWYRSFKSRFEKLDQKTKETIPIPSTRLGDRFDPFGYLDRPASIKEHQQHQKQEQETPVVFSEPFRSRSGSSRHGPIHSEIIHSQTCKNTASPCYCNENRAQVCRRTSRLMSITHSILGSKRPSVASHSRDGNPLRSILHQTSHPPLPPPGTVFAQPSAQPMREEAQRAFATFLRKGGSRELGISDELREYTKACLARSTAPEVFLPLYEEMYHVVETQSLPHFLQHARTNINRPKQVFWYMVGAADFALGALIYLLLTLLLPAHPFGHRAWRLFSLIFACFGAMQAYSAYRGFCTQVWGRSHRQVRPWEMDDLDDEETLVEGTGRNDVEMKEEAYLGEPSQSIHRREIHISLPDEVRPLADLGGTASIPSEEGLDREEEMIKEDGSPALSKSDSVTVALPVLEGREGVENIKEMSEIERRRMEIRKSTVKVPNASEAFPISDDMIIPSSTPQGGGGGGRISFDSRQKREISPFVNDEPIFQSSSSSIRGSINFPNPSSNVGNSGTPLIRTKSRLHSIASQRANKEISNILSKLRKSSPNNSQDNEFEEDYIDPTSQISSTSTSKTLRQRKTTKSLTKKEKGKEKKPKVFGPEKLVEDPRIKKVYRDIKRDILVVGTIVASIWIILCLAVPCAGLASG